MTFSKELEVEIAEKMDASEDAVRSICIKELMEDMDDRGLIAWDYRRELQNYGIAIGVFKEITEEDMQSIIVSSGKKYDFKRNGKYYSFDSWDGLAQG